jgi:predicted RNA polymerase sigma factor
VSASDPHRVIEAIYRIESPKLIARLARMLRDVGLAEELAQDALLPSARGELLQRLGRSAEAREQFERAASLTQNERERMVLLGRASACLRP